jgi:hypothetical protein
MRLPGATAEKVHDLFIPGTRNWDEKEVRKSFMAIEANEVLKVKPSSRSHEDVLAWALEKNGFYSVCSAYRVLKQEQMAMVMASSAEKSASESLVCWEQVWKMPIPPKVRVFW